MVDDSLRVLSDADYIGANLDNIIDAFVEFYGESEREFITQRFRSTIILTLRNNEILKDNIVDVKASLIKEVFNLPKETLIYFNVDNLYKDLTTGTDDELSIMDADELKLLFGETNLNKIKRKVKNGEYPKVNEFIRRYPEVKHLLSFYERQYEEQKEREEKIDQKYYDMLLNEFIDLISPKELEQYKLTNIPPANMRAYFGNNITADISFGDESERELNDPDTPDWKKLLIYTERINYFKYLGLFNNKNTYVVNKKTYDECLKDPRVREVVTRMNTACTKIYERKQEYLRYRAVDITETLDNFRKNRAILDSHNLVDKDDPICPSIYMNPTSCFTENFKYINGQFVFSPVVVINMGSCNIDVGIIHELNHDYEQQTIHVSFEGCYSTCGFEESQLEFNPQEEESIEDTYLEYEDEITRDHEFMSEFINDSIAFDIADIMHKNGHYIYDNYADRSAASYLTLGIIMNDFYQEFKSLIKVSRSHGNLRYLLDRIGEENFEALNDLCNEFYQRFGYGPDAKEVIEMYEDKIETEDTLDLHNMIQRKEQIMASMRDYYSRVKQTL